MIELSITIRAIHLGKDREEQEQLIDTLYEQIESPDRWDFNYNRTAYEPTTGCRPLVGFINQYVNDELADFTTTKPATHRQYGDVLVVLDYIHITTEDAGIEYMFTLEAGSVLKDGAAECRDQIDSETGMAAQKLHDDEDIVAGLQRTADGLDQAIDWITPLCPRSHTNVAEGAVGLFES